MTTAEPDASELLVKALDLAVGASALARYASRHTTDARLRRLFRQFATTSEHQERLLREQLARAGAGSQRRLGREFVGYVVIGLASAAAVLGGASLSARLRRGKGIQDVIGDPLTQALRSLISVTRRYIGSGGDVRDPAPSAGWKPALGTPGGRPGV